MRPRLLTPLRSALVLLTLCVPDGVGVAAQAPTLRFQYAAKIVCSSADLAARLGLVPQAYATTINIHNPSDSTVLILKKLALTVPPGFERPGAVVSIIREPQRIAPDTAVAVDCRELRQQPGTAGGVPSAFEGFVVIYSSASLDVIGVYTVPGGIEVEHIPERLRAGRQ